MGTLIFFLFVGAAILIWLGNRVPPDRSFEAYKARHPGAFRNGRIHCECGGSSIWMKAIGQMPFSTTYAHLCRTCGQELYRSKGV